eukprot:scaffold8028_cov165-Amphora_coffeaeformis.AAC.16
MTSQMLLQLILLLRANWSSSVEGFEVLSQKVQTRTIPLARSSRPIAVRATNDNDDGDDGWGDDSKVKELRALQQERMDASSVTSRSRHDSNNKNGEPERDLFIPIFAVVSLAGLFGAYGYEMLRLYSRGELYLPF